MAQLSPGVQINEIDLSIVVPQLGNATAVFGGKFEKGPSGKYLLITNTEDLITYYGKPSNDNYNDWFQCYNFLQYSNQLLVSRAVDENGTFSESGNQVSVVNEIGKVEVASVPSALQVGSTVKFDANSEDEYKIASIETDVTVAVAQEQELTINSASDGDYTLNITDALGVLTQVTYTADVTTNLDTTDIIATNLGALLESYDASATNIVVVGNVITISASIPGVAMNNVVFVGDMTLVETVANVEGDSYELVFDTITDFSSIAIAGSEILLKDSTLNSFVTAPKEGSNTRTAADLKPEALFIGNEVDYDIIESSIAVDTNDRLKFIAKSAGTDMNGIEIAIAREADFATGTQTVFKGISLNDLFETKPLEANKEIAIVVRKDGVITESRVVSLIEGNKDYRNKLNYVEAIFNVYSDLLYVKDNGLVTDMPASRLYTAATFDDQGVELTPIINDILITSNGTDGSINASDIAESYGNVSDNSIFGKSANTISSSCVCHAA